MSNSSITDGFVCYPQCPKCEGTGHVCENHPDEPWGTGAHDCGGAGMPCQTVWEHCEGCGEDYIVGEESHVGHVTEDLFATPSPKGEK